MLKVALCMLILRFFDQHKICIVPEMREDVYKSLRKDIWMNACSKCRSILEQNSIENKNFQSFKILYIIFTDTPLSVNVNMS